jgi:hypothetical protein
MQLCKYPVMISARFNFPAWCAIEERHGHVTSGLLEYIKQTIKQTPWPESASELYRRTDLSLSAKLVPTFTDRECHVVSVADPYGRILGFLDRSRYFFFQAAPQLYSRGWVDPVPDPLLLGKSGSVGNRTRTSGSVGRNSDLQTTENT